MSAPGRYFSKWARYHLMPESFAHFLSFGSLVMVAAMIPTAFSGPAGTMVDDTELDTKLIRNSGFQPISSAFLIACAANFGVPATRNASAPAAFRDTTCESIVGSVTSYDDATTLLSKSLFKYSRNAATKSLPRSSF